MTSRAELGWATGDRPGELIFHHSVSSAVFASIENSLASSLGRLHPDSLRALEPTTSAVGRYRAVDLAGRAWFIRVSRRVGEGVREKEIVDHLVQAGVPVNAVQVAGMMLMLDGESFRLDVRPFIDNGRHFSGLDDEVVSLGQTMDRCHSALADYPGASQIRMAAIRRGELLDDTRRRLSRMIDDDDFEELPEFADWIRSNKGWLAGLATTFDSSLTEQRDAQCLHGEIHPGNVVFVDGRAVLLDFEEAVHVFAPPAWDLAYAVQRFCLSDDAEVSRRRLACLAEGYGKSLPKLSGVMKHVGWYIALCIVTARLADGIVAPLAELEKCVRLTENANYFRTFERDVCG